MCVYSVHIIGYLRRYQYHSDGASDNIVTYTPVPGQWLCKQRRFLDNGSVNTFPRQRICTQHESYYWKRNVFYAVHAERLQARRSFEFSSVELLVRSVQEAVKKKSERVMLKNPHCEKPLPGNS
jgi:hypothetical protein